MSRATAVLLVLVLLAGCATQKVLFTSMPPGATVVAGKRQGTTPCTLKVPEKLTHAMFRLPSGEEKVLPIPDLDSGLEEVSEVSGKVVGGALMGAGGLVAGAGVALFLLAGWSLDDGPEWYEEEKERDESDAYVAMGIGLVAMVGGLGVFGLGKCIYPDEGDVVLHAEFDGDESPGEEDACYEDVGFGARRLKKATP